MQDSHEPDHNKSWVHSHHREHSLPQTLKQYLIILLSISLLSQPKYFIPTPRRSLLVSLLVLGEKFSRKNPIRKHLLKFGRICRTSAHWRIFWRDKVGQSRREFQHLPGLPFSTLLSFSIPFASGFAGATLPFFVPLPVILMLTSTNVRCQLQS